MAKKEKIPDFVKFKGVMDIPINKIKSNDFNPRERFGQEEEDELVDSIKTKGLLNPVIAYEDNGNFILVDGERRFRACKKVGLEKISARVLKNKPTLLENLSIMFHLHNVYENWTDMAIAVTIQKIMDEIGILTVENIIPEDIKKIKEITSLSEYKINKFLDVLKYPKAVIDKFMEAEKKEKPDLDIDTLSELRRPIKNLEKNMEDILDKYPVETIVDIVIRKKKKNVIATNKELRKLNKIITNAKRNVINFDVAKEKIISFLDNEDKTIEEIYSQTSEAFEQSKYILKTIERLTDDIKNIDLRKLPKDELEHLKEEMEKFTEEIKRKFFDR